MILCLCDNDSPGIDDHAVTIGVASAGMSADLGGGKNIGLVFDGSGTQQDVPVSAAGGNGESRRDRQQIDPFGGIIAKQFRKTQVVTDAQADAPLTGCDNLRCSAGSYLLGFAVPSI